MAAVRFAFDHHFAASPRRVWDELIDWKGHEMWIPSTHVEVHTEGDPTAVGAEFTAWSGPLPTTSIGRRLSLEDRMRVDELDFDDGTTTGFCRVTKLGPMITGSATFEVKPSDDGCVLTWTEDVVVPRTPGALAPVLARVGEAGFRFGFRRLEKKLATTPRTVPAG